MSERTGMLLTESQELDLFNDHEVDSMMTLLENHLVQPQQSQIYNTVFEQDTFQMVEDQKPFQDQILNVSETNEQNGIMPYPGIAELSPSLMPIPPAVISNEEYSGPFNFEVYIDPHHATKNPWVFSSILNKLFITMSNPFPVDFKWDPQPTNLYVRATPLFSLAQHVQELVTRCIPHSLSNDPSNRNIPEEILNHVLRCQTHNAQYYGNLSKKIHFNVLVPLGTPQTGMETVRLMYSFVCKNSCPSGMNRKPFEVVFTLEDEGGNVFGRKKLSVRVCSCPKRDKEKEERDNQKEPSDGRLPQGKKRKIDKNDKKPPSMANLNSPIDMKDYLVHFRICGKQNLQSILKYAHDLMAGDLVRHGHHDSFQKCLNDIGELLKNVD